MTSDNDTSDMFHSEKDQLDLAAALEGAASVAFKAGDMVLCAQLAQAAALYRCADALADILQLLGDWPLK